MRPIVAFGLLALAAAIGSGAAFAQSYQPGQQVEYKAQSWPEKWEKGVIVKELPGGTQVLVRQAPTQFFPDGFERAYALADVRPATRAAPAPNQAAARAAQPARPKAAAAPPAGARLVAPPGGKAGAGGGTGLMSQQDVLGFLQARLGTGDPFMNPRREAVLQALREEILRRGVDFHRQAIGPFANELAKYGALSNVTYALSNNFGPPAALSDLTGKWRIAKVGATTSVTRNNRAYQRQEYAGLAGSLTVNPGGTYVWDSPSGLLRGNWRKATPDEMARSDKGGEGVVLLGAKSGADWLVYKRAEEGPEGTGIMITDLATRNLRERGTR
jgi:hypothetical protein